MIPVLNCKKKKIIIPSDKRQSLLPREVAGRWNDCWTRSLPFKGFPPIAFLPHLSIHLVLFPPTSPIYSASLSQPPPISSAIKSSGDVPADGD